LLPLLFFLLLEVMLRIFNYGGNLDLFITVPGGYEEYSMCNPRVTRRYFAVQPNIPDPSNDIFLKEKCSSVLTIREIEPFHIFVPNGAVFVTSKNMIIKHNKLWDDNKKLMLMPQDRSIDVDTETDFLLAEKLLSMKHENK